MFMSAWKNVYDVTLLADSKKCGLILSLMYWPFYLITLYVTNPPSLLLHPPPTEALLILLELWLPISVIRTPPSPYPMDALFFLLTFQHIWAILPECPPHSTLLLTLHDELTPLLVCPLSSAYALTTHTGHPLQLCPPYLSLALTSTCGSSHLCCWFLLSSP